MDARLKLRTSPILAIVTSLGLAAVFAACGNSETPTTANGGAGTYTGSTAPSLPDAFDVNDRSQVVAVLAKLDVESPAIEPFGTDRAGGATGDVFPTWPTGEVRRDGLTTYRIDATAAYENDGSLRFMKGSTLLHEARFTPSRAQSIGQIPPAVINPLKVGDTVTWGVWFESRSKKPVTATFKIIDKPALNKALAKLDVNTTLSPILRDLARAQVLQNYGFYSEAAQTFVGINEQDLTVTSVLLNAQDCLRALKLKNTPLFDDVKARAIPVKGGVAAKAEPRLVPTLRANGPVGAPPLAGPARPSLPARGTADTGTPSAEPTGPVDPPAMPPSAGLPTTSDAAMNAPVAGTPDGQPSHAMPDHTPPAHPGVTHPPTAGDPSLPVAPGVTAPSNLPNHPVGPVPPAPGDPVVAPPPAPPGAGIDPMAPVPPTPPTPPNTPPAPVNPPAPPPAPPGPSTPPPPLPPLVPDPAAPVPDTPPTPPTYTPPTNVPVNPNDHPAPDNTPPKDDKGDKDKEKDKSKEKDDKEKDKEKKDR